MRPALAPQLQAAPAPAPAPKPSAGRAAPKAQTQGNQAALRRLQTKLIVGAVDDPLEREADHVAAQVMRMPDSGIMRDGPAAPPRISRKCAACGEEESVRRQPTGAQREGGDAPAGVEDVLRAPAQGLDASTRNFFEPRFGADFGGVRVHQGTRAAESARTLNAQAYAIGGHIVLGAGAAPGRTSLMAHELAHVMQQRGDGVLRRQPPPAPQPRPAPSCEEVCGEGEKCVREPDEQCSTDQMSAVCGAQAGGGCNGGSMKAAQDGIANAINVLDNSPDSPKLLKSLQDNFSWSKGGAPADLPAKVRATLNRALTRTGQFNLCVKCMSACGKDPDQPGKPVTVAMIYRARNRSCTGQNCFALCPAFFAHPADQPHALAHEFHHLVLPPTGDDKYRGTPGYPAAAPVMLFMPDAYASLVDDLKAAAPAAPAPAPAPGAPAPGPSGAPAPARPPGS
jgi:hypothetical protein